MIVPIPYLLNWKLWGRAQQSVFKQAFQVILWDDEALNHSSKPVILNTGCTLESSDDQAPHAPPPPKILI